MPRARSALRPPHVPGLPAERRCCRRSEDRRRQRVFSLGPTVGAIDVPAAATEAFMAIGSYSLAVVPQDGALSRRRAPPDRCARPKAIDNPGPVPVPTSFVEKNGSTASPGFQRPFLLRCGKNDLSGGSNAELGLLVGVLYVQTDRDFAAGDHCTSGVHGKIQQSNLSAHSS